MRLRLEAVSSGVMDFNPVRRAAETNLDDVDRREALIIVAPG